MDAPSRVIVVQVELALSLYSHNRDVMLPDDESVKVTVNGLGPDVGVPENKATGAAGVDFSTTRITFWATMLSPLPLTIKLWSRASLAPFERALVTS